MPRPYDARQCMIIIFTAYKEDAKGQLQLAQKWNRCDIVTNELFMSMVNHLDWQVRSESLI